MLSLKKALLRKHILHLLQYRSPADQETKSRQIVRWLMSIESFSTALRSSRLMSFVSMPTEVDTFPLLSGLTAGNSIIVPYCESGEIVPLRIFSIDELQPSAAMNLLEPKPIYRNDAARHVLLNQIDLLLVPGLAFDRQGNRLGRGKGYYDRFLRKLPAETCTLGLAFEEMVYEEIPHDENDSPVNKVITETHIYPQQDIKISTTGTAQQRK